ncbi:glycosyl hydrolase [Bacteroides bouchesdurhonensis]|uniref:glycosyl hydrolase n=1 Tax=Bacteroides bouchesdurhonensis TaxID=1841855 RepID=UPI00097F85CE|nr:glycosyl hydrolase [Bacteroides bouchesdurhonensis]
MRTVILCLLLSVFSSVVRAEQKDKFIPFEKIESGFRQVPNDVRIAVYWYWISDNISKEGVIKDLEAMKAAGISRAYIGNIGLGDITAGKHKILTEGWWEIVHAALKKATELDIEIGIFNSPGWSQSGGPWIKPNESMRYLASSELRVKGPKMLQTDLPVIAEDAEDVKVIAFPAPTGDVVRGNWKVKKQEGKEEVVEMKLLQETTVRSFSLQVNTPIKTDADLYIKEGNEYRILKKIHIDRSNAALNVGFIPYPPIVISLPEVKGQEFRLVIHAGGNAELDIVLSSQPMLERYPEKMLAKMFQTPLPLWHDYMWDRMPGLSDKDYLIKTDKVVDITSSFKDGKLNWAVPEGEWVIMRTGMRSTRVTNSPASPEGTGLEVDKMSKKHVATHFDAYIGEILRRIPAQDRKTFKVVVQDSYETGGQNWTDDMIASFKKKYGYDPVVYLPVLKGMIVGSPDQSDRFLWDLRRLVADRVAYDYVGGLREVCHKHGLTTWLENYGHWGFPGEFLQYGGQSDEVGGEFWCEGSLGDIENRAASSCAHIYGKKKVWAESFTAGGPNFHRYPYLMKQRGDRFFTEGINSTLLHVYIHQPSSDRLPGMSAWFGCEFNRNNTWFGQMDVFTGYLKRCNFMLQQGQYVADAAYFIGEDAPKMTGVCDPALPKGYSFDYINAEVLLNQASVKDGKLTLQSGMQYRILVLPRQNTMRPEILKKVRELVKSGLVIVGTAPEYSPSLAGYPKADQEVKSMASDLWNRQGSGLIYGKGRVFSSNESLDKVFATLSLSPDCSVSNDAPVLFIHRTTSDGDFYFISNQSDKAISFDATFRISSKVPELWNPLTQDMRLLPEYSEKGDLTTVPLQLKAFESSFIVFRKKSETKQSGSNYPQSEVVVKVDSPWTVAFDKNARGPEEAVTFSTPIDWKDSEDARIKYYSGTAIYTNTFNLEKLPKKQFYIDLGKVMVMAKVYVNDQYAGGVWTNPYQLNITDYLRTGKNTLKIEVVNNWENRLIGDQQLPEESRPTWTAVNPWNANSPLQSSGLLGPVQIEAYDYLMTK